MTSGTVKEYLRDNSLSGQCQITEIIEGEKPIIRLNATWFHPQGGGQKSDIGSIGSSDIIHVVHNGEMVDHYVDAIDDLEIGPSNFQIDAENRVRNAKWHTAGHLIASAAEELEPSLKAISGHQWPGEGRVEFEGLVEEKDRFIEGLQSKVDIDVERKLIVKQFGDPFDDRCIGIGNYSPIPCGGTHLGSLAEIGRIKITKVKTSRGRTKVSYDIAES